MIIYNTCFRPSSVCSGGRSRLHLIDLSCPPSISASDVNIAPTHNALGSIIVAMLNGMKKVPYPNSKITRYVAVCFS